MSLRAHLQVRASSNYNNLPLAPKHVAARKSVLARAAPALADYHVADYQPGSVAAEAAAKVGITDAMVDCTQNMWTDVTGGSNLDPDAKLAAQTAAGVLLFQNLFKAQPGSLELFSFKDSKKFDRKLQEHGLQAVDGLDRVVYGLGDLTSLVPYLRALHKRHIKYGVILEHYDMLATSLLVTLEQAFARQLTADEIDAWTAVMTLVRNAAEAEELDLDD